MSQPIRWRVAVWGLFLLFLGVLLFTHPGRVDDVEAERRFEVATNVLNGEGPVIRDPQLLNSTLPKDPRSSKRYSVSGPAGSLVAAPFLYAAKAMGLDSLPSQRFAFATVGLFAGALLVPLLMAFYRRLGVSLRLAVAWTAATCFATLWWPGSTTTLDQNQHGLILLAALLAAWESGRTRKAYWTLLAGLLMGLLVNYQQEYTLLIPAVGIALLARPFEGGGSGSSQLYSIRAKPWGRIFLYGLAVAVGVGGYIYYNWTRFGQLGVPAAPSSTEVAASPWANLLTLLVSPGKGLIWYSPIVLLGFLGLRKMARRAPRLLLALLASSLVVLAIGSRAYMGTEVSWGPQAILAIVPVWALLLPYAADSPWVRRVAIPLIGIGVFVSVLGVSVDPLRWFHHHRMSVASARKEPWIGADRSPLLQRQAEAREVWKSRDQKRPIFDATLTGEPTRAPSLTAKQVVTKEPQPSPDLHQKNPQEYYNRQLAWQQRATVKQWDQQPFAQKVEILNRPRPWWGWMGLASEEQRPLETKLLWLGCIALLSVGAGMLVYVRLRRRPAYLDYIGQSSIEGFSPEPEREREPVGVG